MFPKSAETAARPKITSLSRQVHSRRGASPPESSVWRQKAAVASARPRRAVRGQQYQEVRSGKPTAANASRRIFFLAASLNGKAEKKVSIDASCRRFIVFSVQYNACAWFPAASLIAAAKALIDTDTGAEEIARKAMAIAAEICVYTNDKVTVEVIDAA